MKLSQPIFVDEGVSIYSVKNQHRHPTPTLTAIYYMLFIAQTIEISGSNQNKSCLLILEESENDTGANFSVIQQLYN